MPPSAKNTEFSLNKLTTGYKIYILAFQRANSLRRLFNSLLNSCEKQLADIHLIVSLDSGYSEQVKKAADDLKWPFGDVKIITHDDHLGLNRHMWRLFDIAAQDESDQKIVFLEDDAFVVKGYFEMLDLLSEQVSEEKELFGAGLCAYSRNEDLGIPFTPLKSNLPYFQMQKASTRGWTTTSEKLKEIIKWKETFSGDFSFLPRYMRDWRNDVWEKFVTAFLISNHKYLLFPYDSVMTVYGEPGVHYNSEIHRFMSQSFLSRLDFTVPDKGSMSGNVLRYDAFYNMDCTNLRDQTGSLIEWPGDFDVDFYGTKDRSQLSHEFVLTSNFRKNTSFQKSFGMDLIPIEQNILLNNAGNDLRLIRSRDLPKQRKWGIYRQKYKFRLHSQTYQTILDGIRMKITRIFR